MERSNPLSRDDGEPDDSGKEANTSSEVIAESVVVAGSCKVLTAYKAPEPVRHATGCAGWQTGSYI